MAARLKEGFGSNRQREILLARQRWHSSPMRIAFVLWHGHTGGNQTVTAAIVATLRSAGVDARIVFVGAEDALTRHLDRDGIPRSSLGFDRGRKVVLHARRFARLVRDAGPDCAVLVSSGYLAAVLRTGGYTAPIIAVEHGTLLQVDQLPTIPRWLRRLDRRSGIWACKAEVAVSHYMLSKLEKHPHPRELYCIPNGVDLARFAPSASDDRQERPETIVGCAARLIHGKGVETAIQALAALRSRPDIRLQVAGDGPEHDRLAALARQLKVNAQLELRGRVTDMPAFWRNADIAVVPSNQWIESFSMAAVEAMASGVPVIASAAGALAEVVDDGRTGIHFPPGDADALAAAITRYADNPQLRRQHGIHARLESEARFGIERCANAYAELCHELINRGTTSAEPRQTAM
jgi:glycosyltransferase involved in cell wall biosynthesis